MGEKMGTCKVIRKGEEWGGRSRKEKGRVLQREERGREEGRLGEGPREIE
jgi:hypothetical protein